VLIVTSNNPPVNALSAPVRQGLVEAIGQAEGDDEVKAVVIACEGQTFFAGADITEFGKPPIMPWLPEVVDGSKPARSRWSRPSTEPRSAAGSKWLWAATIAWRCLRRSSALRK
jgi:enoyl-CoA hydratase/carnithine racemase